MVNYTYSIHISEILSESEKWVITHNWFGKIEYRELEKFGNRHAVFENDSEWGAVHYDQHNATSFPIGTVNHLAKWGNEETGLDEGLLRLVGWIGLLYVEGKSIR
ncbi:MAG: hypothetical protein K5798_03860 [Nitrosopumilus sp.]|uniref:hypothetical protein n=1 Tax=Nitrosopumilus sp. TaxID=2024843 RepID=UPI00243253B6|nr:hypothetical protein [Nitrosopumilus sp.]MCV0366388.1 hypothetical protein [Nitrosopumilus sp.]